MNNNLHELVKDLFPNYIEKLTSDETNKFIEEHISSCKECKETLNKMRATMKEENHTDLKDKKVKFAKKVNRRLKLSKLFILLIIIVILVVVGNYFRKVTILKKLASLNVESNNYMINVINSNENNSYQKMIDWVRNDQTYYYKDGKLLNVSEQAFVNAVDKDMFQVRNKTKMYFVDNKYYTFNYDSYDSQKLENVDIEDVSNGTGVQPKQEISTFSTRLNNGHYSTENIFKLAFKVKITTENFDGIDCYKIQHNNSSEYYEKVTGLLRKGDNSEYYYYFDLVNDSVFEIPEISEGTPIIEDGIAVKAGGDSYEE